jgi:hypothetical protein
VVVVSGDGGGAIRKFLLDAFGDLMVEGVDGVVFSVLGLDDFS